MALCNEACCNETKRAEQRAEQEAADFRSHLEFYRRQAIARGQTADRVITLDPLPARPVEPEVVQSKRFTPKGHALTVAEQRPLSCPCDCRCQNLRTLAEPGVCRDCRNGSHLRA